VLPFYILHEPVIVAAVWAVVRWHAPILGRYLRLVIVPFGGTLGPYDYWSAGSTSSSSCSV
jgi:hypothetical protein